GYIPSFVDAETRAATTNKAKGNLLSLMALIKLQQGGRSDSLVKGALASSSDGETLLNAGDYYTKTGAHQNAFESYQKIVWHTPENTAAAGKMKAAYQAWQKGLDGFEKHLAELDEHWRTEMTKRLKKEIINVKSPEFVSSLVDLNGQPVAKEAFSNKILVLDFWATWCVPCMQEMPYLQKVYDQFKADSNVQFLVINSGAKNTLADAQGWWGNKRYSFPVYYNTDLMIGEKLGFNVIPAVYIIDQSGNIRFKTIGFEGPAIERMIGAAINLLKAPTL
ncbi:MAG TPA: TlpA disulfide reductase family protein, partial [Flavisolibacter sp.]|nr:TlpA disulfide reductase family protein [Flavisolibacter sp.]